MRLAAILLLALVVPVAASASDIPRTGLLLALADHLETVDPARFDMAMWASSDDPDGSDFTGCAAGHATRLYAGLGFRLEPDRDGRPRPAYAGLVGIEACRSFFGIGRADASDLFSGHRDTAANHDPAAIAARVRAVAARLDGGPARKGLAPGPTSLASTTGRP